MSSKSKKKNFKNVSFFSSDLKGQGRLYRLFLDYSYKRNFIDAIFFYISQIISAFAIILVGGKIIQALALNFGDVGLSNIHALSLGLTLLAVIFNSFSVLHAKKLLDNMKSLLLVCLALVLTYFFGILIGLLPLTYLSMQDKK